MTTARLRTRRQLVATSLLLPALALGAEPRWNFNEPASRAPAQVSPPRPKPAPVAPAPGQKPPQGPGVTRGPTKALTVVDRNCPRLVQPYKLSDNAAALAIVGAQETLADVLKRAPQGLTGLAPRSGGGAPGVKGDVTASMRSSAKQLNWLPMPAEVAYGQRLHDQQTLVLERDSRQGRQHYPAADRLLQEVLAGVGEPHDYTFRLFILKNSTRNAMALPGGFLYVDQGLLASPDALPKARFALAHEIAHVLQRHETKELQAVVIDSVQTRQDLARVLTTTRSDPNTILSMVKAEKNRYTRHHVDQELQADACAVRMLARTLPDRAALADAINAFLKELPPPAPAPATAPAGALSDIVDTPLKRHPTTLERQQNLRAIYGEVTAGTR